MNQQYLPNQTLRDLGAILVVTAELAWHGTKHLAKRLHPLVTPPEDVEFRSSIGATYSGIVLIEDNEIFAGAIIRTGTATTTVEDLRGDLFTTRRRRPVVTPPPASDPYECRLPGWAEDPRDEEDPWPYRP